MLPEKLILKYINGNCNIFALALKELKPDISIVVKYIFIKDKNKDLEIISHAWCQDENNIYYDARGSSLKEGLSVSKSNELFISNFYNNNTAKTIENSYEELYSWTKKFMKNEKLLRKDIEKAKKNILKFNFLNIF